MLTPEKTRRGSLKDWSVLPNYGSAFIEDFDDHHRHHDDGSHGHHRQQSQQAIASEGEGNEVARATEPSSAGHEQVPWHYDSRDKAKTEQQGPLTNPYAEIYQELAKSPGLVEDDEKQDRSASPLSPLFPVGREDEAQSPAFPQSSSRVLKEGTKSNNTHILEPVAEESFIDSEADSSRGLKGQSFQQDLAAVPQEAGNTSTTSVHVTALTTDAPLLSPGRQSTESRQRQRRLSKTTSLHTYSPVSALPGDHRARTSSIASSAVSGPNTVTSSSGNTFNSVENATLEYGQRLSWQALSGDRNSKMQLKSPRGDGQEGKGFHASLKKFLQDDDFEPWRSSPAQAKPKAESLPPDPNEQGNRKASKGYHAVLVRQRTKSQPVKIPHTTQGQDEYREILKELLPLDSGLRKQAKGVALPKESKKTSMTPATAGGEKHLSSLILGALKKRKSTAGLRESSKSMLLSSEKGEQVPVPTLSIRDKVISAPLGARHICTGALNAVMDRESPFGRRPSSPVKGYIDVPFGAVSVNTGDELAFYPIERHGLSSIPSTYQGKESVAHANLHDAMQSTSDRSSPSYRSQTSENASLSPAFFSSPMSSTSSHSEEWPGTPRAFSPYASSAPFSNITSISEEHHSTETANHEPPVDFWAVSFAEAQAGEGDFVAPHATLVKSGKVAMLSTQEKARRRASKASLRI